MGVDYEEHIVLPTDTLQGICLAYRIHATRLRQVNRFSGNSLLLAPKRLIIPISKKALKNGTIRVQDRDSPEFKIHFFHSEFPRLGITGAKAYLELADWNLEDAITSAKEDGEWEQKEQVKDSSGQIHMSFDVKNGIESQFHTRGAGMAPRTDKTTRQAAPPVPPKASFNLPVVNDEGFMASKTVKPEEMYKVAHQHDSFGVEMQTLVSKEKHSETKEAYP